MIHHQDFTEGVPVPWILLRCFVIGWGGGSEITSNSIGVTIESVRRLAAWNMYFFFGTKNDIPFGRFKEAAKEKTEEEMDDHDEHQLFVG